MKLEALWGWFSFKCQHHLWFVWFLCQTFIFLPGADFHSRTESCCQWLWKLSVMSLNVSVQVCKIHVLNLFQLLFEGSLFHVALAMCQAEALIEWGAFYYKYMWVAESKVWRQLARSLCSEVTANVLLCRGSCLRICDMSHDTCECAFMSVCGLLRVNATFLSKNSECYWCWIGAEVTPGSCKKLSE